eukprot:12098053-Alexandrium_andersonii.AAC.1
MASGKSPENWPHVCFVIQLVVGGWGTASQSSPLSRSNRCRESPAMRGLTPALRSEVVYGDYDH